MRRANRYLGLFSVLAAAAAGASCGDVVRSSRAPVILVINSLQAAAGNTPTTFAGTLNSDVLNMMTTPAPCSPTAPCPTVFNDLGQAQFAVVMKDAAVTPTSNNQVTIKRYHIQYTRADGRNTQGVDVPFAVDGVATVTVVPGTSATVSFDLVRHAAKEEAPLVQLITNQNILSVMATITFYGTDVVGNDVQVTGQIQITFGNFGG